LVLLLIALRGVEPERVWDGLLQANPVWVAAAFLSFLLTTAAKICRWQGLFPDGQRPDLILLGRALLVGQLANALLPVRSGELARAYLVGAGGSFSRVTSLATIAVEKAFDALLLLICVGIAAYLAPLPPWVDLSVAGLAAGGLLLIVLVGFLPEQGVRGWIGRWKHRFPWRIGERLGEWLRRGLEGLAALREPRMAFTAWAWSAAIWAMATGTNLLLFKAFDLALSAGAALLILVLIQIGTAPPSAPAWLGVFHALAFLGLRTFAVDSASALAYATVLHAIVVLPQIVLGAIALALGQRSDVVALLSRRL
jgi:uncharacterized protein (TIRG00374 family)